MTKASRVVPLCPGSEVFVEVDEPAAQFPVFKLSAKGQLQMRWVFGAETLHVQTTLGDWELPAELARGLRDWLNTHVKD